MRGSETAVSNSRSVRGYRCRGNGGIQFNEHVDGSCHGKDVTQIEIIITPVRPSVSEVKDLQGKLAGVRREGKVGNEVGQEANILSPVGQLWGWWRWLPLCAPLVICSLKGEGIYNDICAHASRETKL